MIAAGALAIGASFYDGRPDWPEELRVLTEYENVKRELKISSIPIQDLAYDSVDYYRNHARKLVTKRDSLEQVMESDSAVVNEIKSYNENYRSAANHGRLAALIMASGIVSVFLGLGFSFQETPKS